MYEFLLVDFVYFCVLLRYGVSLVFFRPTEDDIFWLPAWISGGVCLGECHWKSVLGIGRVILEVDT